MYFLLFDIHALPHTNDFYFFLQLILYFLNSLGELY